MWRDYLVQAQAHGLFETLKTRLVELAFPVRKGMATDPEYLAAKRRGIPPEGMDGATGVVLEAPERLRLSIYESAAGPTPAIVAGTHRDFASLVRALVFQNEPKPIPDSMGSLMVTGYNNWGRIRAYRSEWERNHPGGDWAGEFRRLKGRKELYQDAFMILSEGPYSGVPAQELGLTEEEWLPMSRAIRLEHEATHYFTKRLFGMMTKDLYHEIVADYMGITRAAGTYRPDWALRFLGLEDYPRYRPGGRLEHYAAAHPHPGRAMPRLARTAMRYVERLRAIQPAGDEEARGPTGRAGTLMRLLTAEGPREERRKA